MEGGSKGLWGSCTKVPPKEILPCQIWDTPQIGAATHALRGRRGTQGSVWVTHSKLWGGRHNPVCPHSELRYGAHTPVPLLSP